MEPRTRFQGKNSASLYSLAGRYDNPIPTRFLAPIIFLQIPALYYTDSFILSWGGIPEQRCLKSKKTFSQVCFSMNKKVYYWKESKKVKILFQHRVNNCKRSGFVANCAYAVALNKKVTHLPFYHAIVLNSPNGSWSEKTSWNVQFSANIPE